MKRTLAITAMAALLALSLSLAGCGAERAGDADTSYGAAGGTGAANTVQNNGGTANGGAGTTNNGLGGVTGAVGRGYGYGYGSARYGTNDGTNTNGTSDWSNSEYTATNNGGYISRSDRNAQVSAGRYALMLENGRVHDTDGFLFDGENANWRTF